MPSKSEVFRIRGFFTLLLFLSALVAAVSGIALYLRPEGSLARWVNWTWLGLDKSHWEAVHAAFVLLSLTAALIHLCYNWKPFTGYIKKKSALILPSGKRLPYIREWLAALAIASVVLIAAIAEWQPLALLIDLRTQIKDGKYSMSVRPPVVDADRLTIAQLCRIIGVSEQSALEKVRAHGISADDASMTLGTLARQHSLSPEALYQLLK